LRRQHPARRTRSLGARTGTFDNDNAVKALLSKGPRYREADNPCANDYNIRSFELPIRYVISHRLELIAMMTEAAISKSSIQWLKWANRGCPVVLAELY
jgi:hypothetical protein